MFPTDILAAYLVAVLLVVVAPGPDNILAIGRGLSQGLAAVKLSSWLERRPKATTWLNVGAGLNFVASGISSLALGNRR